MTVFASLKHTWHLFWAYYGALRFWFPSGKLYVIGVTGTSGKSSVVQHLRLMLESRGFRVGSLSTVDFVIAGKQTLNAEKMTMLGRARTQAFLHQMVLEKCDIAIVETSSQGVLQSRHRGIHYDTILLTNFYPEHIEAHGGYDKYREAKAKIFSYIAQSKRKKRKKLSEKIRARFSSKVPKVCVANAEAGDLTYFVNHPFDEVYFVEKEGGVPSGVEGNKKIHELVIKNISREGEGQVWEVNGTRATTRLLGPFEPTNISLCIGTLMALGETLPEAGQAASATEPVPGRIESIPEAKPLQFTAIVDYAFEPVAMRALYEVAEALPHKRIIHVFGSTGGGRDVARRFTVGALVGNKASVCIVTDEDPYDDNPMDIINDVASAVRSTGKIDGETLFVIPDREEAIFSAIRMAEKDDIVLVTGKGSEQAMVVKGKLIPWDDRHIVRTACARKQAQTL